MSYVDTLREGIENSCTFIEDQLRWIENSTPGIAKWLIDEYVSQQPIPHPLKDLLRDRLTGEIATAVSAPIVECARQVREGVAFVRKAYAFLGSPDTLREAANQIDKGIVDPSEELATKLVLSKIPSALLANWNDAAASQAYQFKIDGRDAAVRAGKEDASELADGLRNAADAIENFIVNLSMAVAGVVAAIAGVVTAIAGAATVVLLVAGIIGAIAGVGTAIGGIISLFSSTAQDVDSTLRGLEPTISAWPKAFA